MRVGELLKVDSRIAYRWHGLPGARRRIRVWMTHSRTEALRVCLSEQRAVMAKGDSGTIVAWRDTIGRLRCRFIRGGEVVSDEEGISGKKFGHWLAEWWPRMEGCESDDDKSIYRRQACGDRKKQTTGIEDLTEELPESKQASDR